MGKIVYFWWTIGFVLLALETLVPGATLLWFGLAALGVGLVVLVIPGLSIIGQVVLFGIFSAVTLAIYWKFFRATHHESDQPLLNRRGEQMIGRVFVVEEAIEHGQGKVRVGDTVWSVLGEDCAVGSRVRVLDVLDNKLKVEPAQ
ncbi:hypothetical protein C7S18_07565 [Ahniella affigens]|uniref:NfeD-like C-terminal domain-containing protein n=1 Tax=Ahniella affigens TaxID=2021234 RepID=A0A2P1PQE8_9GAMM|nr:NfeD family protein [Ahniella affigens]AVP97059.1 hypothetical protein C7S18_07565 [Ahniella affigens]